MKDKPISLILGLFLLMSLAFSQTSSAADDTTLARVRLVNIVFGSSPTDMYLDGSIILLGDSQRELSSIPVGTFTGFSYVEPGTHSVAVVPTGESLEDATINLEISRFSSSALNAYRKL